MERNLPESDPFTGQSAGVTTLLPHQPSLDRVCGCAATRIQNLASKLQPTAAREAGASGTHCYPETAKKIIYRDRVLASRE